MDFKTRTICRKEEIECKRTPGNNCEKKRCFDIICKKVEEKCQKKCYKCKEEKDPQEEKEKPPPPDEKEKPPPPEEKKKPPPPDEKEKPPPPDEKEKPPPPEEKDIIYKPPNGCPEIKLNWWVDLKKDPVPNRPSHCEGPAPVYPITIETKADGDLDCKDCLIPEFYKMGPENQWRNPPRERFKQAFGGPDCKTKLTSIQLKERDKTLQRYGAYPDWIKYPCTGAPPGYKYDTSAYRWICTDKAEAAKYHNENEGSLAVWKMNQGNPEIDDGLPRR